MGDGRRAAAGAGQRVGQQRDARAVGERGQRGAERGIALGAAGDDHGVRARLELGAQPVDSARGGSPAARGRVTHGRPPARPLSSSGSGPSGTSGSRSAKFRWTGPGRPPTAVQKARHASWRSHRSRSGVAGCESTSRYHLAALP